MIARAALLAALVLGGCSTTSETRGESRAASADLDAVVEFLLTAASTDFHAHHPPDPVRFRDVRLGHLTTGEGMERYLLCGEFLPAGEKGDVGWTPFATIQTSDYEQWIGAQATGFCEHSNVTWHEEGDLSSALQSRLDALRQGSGS